MSAGKTEPVSAIVAAILNRPQPKRVLYFINEKVEWSLTRYVWTGCTDVKLRDEIMDNAPELITQMIRKQGLHMISQSHGESSFNDLLITAYCQIERTLYKYRAAPHCRACFQLERPQVSMLHQPGETEYGILTVDEAIGRVKGRCPNCDADLNSDVPVLPEQDVYGGTEAVMYRGLSKVFNMWNQISRTVILAHIKKDGRDRKNGPAYMNHLSSRHRPKTGILLKFLEEARETWALNDAVIHVLDAIAWLFDHDASPQVSLITKIAARTGLSRHFINSVLTMAKMHGAGEPRPVAVRSKSADDQERE